MADYSEAEQSLIQAIHDATEHAQRTMGDRNVNGALGYARTARALAEARAWLVSPGQAHGGEVTPQKG